MHHVSNEYAWAAYVAISVKVELVPVIGRWFCMGCSCTDGRLFLQDIPSIIKTCKAPGPLYLSSLSNEELQLLDNMMNRLYKIAEVAAQVTVAST